MDWLKRHSHFIVWIIGWHIVAIGIGLTIGSLASCGGNSRRIVQPRAPEPLTWSTVCDAEDIEILRQAFGYWRQAGRDFREVPCAASETPRTVQVLFDRTAPLPRRAGMTSTHRATHGTLLAGGPMGGTSFSGPNTLCRSTFWLIVLHPPYSENEPHVRETIVRHGVGLDHVPLPGYLMFPAVDYNTAHPVELCGYEQEILH